ncbi:MAG: hypothetical protein AB1421_15790 [Pseudomonadota bacterium]
MIGCPPDAPALQRFIQALDTLPPRPHHAALLEAANSLVPDCPFRHALTRGGWYRPGGVIRPDGTRLADDLETWAEAELADCDEDMGLFLERHADAGLLATRQAGRTHYFVAPIGMAPADYLQLEVEEVQEVLDRQLIHPAAPPTDLPELTEPLDPALVPPQPVDRPRYRFRRLTDLRQVLARQPAAPGSLAPLARFMAEWTESSAGAQGHFSDHWIVAVREHLDRYRNTQLNATPVSRHGRKLKTFQWQTDARGTGLADQLHAFDRAAGYPAAWYFHLVAGAITPRPVAYALAEDLAADYHYLPTSDQKILETWLTAPYSI